MAERNPNRAQLDFPALVADIITELRLAGQVGLLDFSDVVQPVYIVSSRGGSLPVTVRSPTFTSAGFLGGITISPLANVILQDTGPLPAGDYDIWASIAVNGVMSAPGGISLQHRNAANLATLRNILNLPMTTANHHGTVFLPVIGYTLALNERLRFQAVVGNVTGAVTTDMGFQLRPTP